MNIANEAKKEYLETLLKDAARKLAEAEVSYAYWADLSSKIEERELNIKKVLEYEMQSNPQDYQKIKELKEKLKEQQSQKEISTAKGRTLSISVHLQNLELDMEKQISLIEIIENKLKNN